MMMREYRSSVRAHGKSQLEIKNRYPLQKSRKPSFYTLQAWFYLPAQLGIREPRYGVDDFFNDVKSQTRFSISYISLKRLIDPDCTVSPLYRINSLLSRPSLSIDVEAPRILYELRTLATIYSTEMKATWRLLYRLSGEGARQALEEKALAYIGEIRAFLKEFRKLHPRFIDPAISDKLRAGLRWTDEAISLSTDKILFLIRSIFPDQEILQDIDSLMEQEKMYRKRTGYPAFLEEEDPREVERILYRQSILKKWSQTVLYMSREETKTRKSVGHIIAGTAAAIAMSFAVVATFFAETLFASYSVPWALVIVVSYILKDRLKEILRSILVKVMPRLISDRSERLIDQATQKGVGKTRSMVRFIRPFEAPDRVRNLRKSGSNPFRSILPEESVIHFRKDVSLDNRSLFKEHTRIEAITEIIRIKMDHFLEEMDASKKYLYTWLDGEAKAVKGKRVYHINLILSLSGKGREEKLFRYRLVVNHQGLQRIEDIAETEQFSEVP